jgi:hypothetical protein
LLLERSRKAAKKTLLSALQDAKENNLLSRIPLILISLTKLELKIGNLKQARKYKDEEREEIKAGDRFWEDYFFLLIAENRFDEAIHLAEKYISTDSGEKINKAKEIESLLALSQAWHGKRDQVKAHDYMELARALMKKTGCYYDKDILEETEAMLAKAKG